MRCCILIPHFCHELLIGRVLEQIRSLGLKVVVVDDGSPASQLAMLEATLRQFPEVSLESLPINGGKGAAIFHGLTWAARQGYTHIVQIDADGQHQVADIDPLLRAAQASPTALISGYPIFDASVPRMRLKGRKVSVFWAQVNTWSKDIVDPMCGLRVYPVQTTLRLIGRRKHGMRMEFDTEILVRAHWAGVPLIFRPVQVTYPIDGVSHFRMFHDNLRISWMHTRLFFGMVLRAPLLAMRKARAAISA